MGYKTFPAEKSKNEKKKKKKKVDTKPSQKKKKTYWKTNGSHTNISKRRRVFSLPNKIYYIPP
jgi:hypothetical protein